MLDVILAAVFLAVAVFLLMAPERHFRGGTRRVRVVGAATSFVAAPALAADRVVG